MKPSHHPLVAALPIFAASATVITISSAAAVPLYWKTNTAAAWNSSTWATSPGGAYDQPWAAGSSVVFEDNLGTTLTIAGPSAATDFSGITANENVTVTAANTLGTGGTMATIDVVAGKTLDFAGQALSTAPGTGFIKNGPGTWSLSNSAAYPGGFTLNAGTVAIGNANAMGSGGALVINGGTIRSTGTGAQNLGGKFTSIALGGDVTLGDVTNNGALTFNTATSLGAATRTFTVNSLVTHTGAISGAGVGIIKAGPGVLSLGGTNTYGGPTTISAGVLTLTNSAALPGSLTTNGTYSVASGAGLAVPNTVTDANITSMLATTNFAAGSAIGFDTTAAARTYSANLGNIAAGNLGLVKTGSNALTLSGNNTYSGGTAVWQSNDSVGITVASATALGTGAVVVNGGQSFSGAVSVNTNLTVNNALTLKRGATGGNRALLALAAGANWSGNITVDNSSPNGLAAIMTGGTTAATACVVSGNIGYSTLGTPSSASATLALRTSNNFGRVTGSIGLSNGYLVLLDSSKWEFSNASNTWGTLDLSNAGAVATVGATNTLSPSGVVTSTVGGTLQLNNQLATTAYNQSIAGLSGNVKVGLATGAATLTLNTSADQTSSGVISGAISLVKSGTGKQTLSGVNTYTGSTTVSGGTLSFGSTGVMPALADLSISSGTLDLRKGTSVRSQQVNNLTLSNATVEFGLNASPDQIDAAGATVSGSNTLKIYGSTPVGSYELIKTGAPLSGNFTLDTSGVTPSGFPTSYSGSIQGNSYVLNVTGAETPLTAFWRGDVSSIWNDGSLAPNSNWATDSNGTTDAHQIPGPISDVHFSAATTANTNTTLGQNISINSLSFDTGSATVGGTHTLTILNESGSGLDVYSGATATIATGGLVCTSASSVHEGGTLTVNSGGLGSGQLVVDGVLNLNMNLANESLAGGPTGAISRGIAGAGTLTISGATPSLYEGSIGNGIGGGTIALSKGGASTLTLSGNNSYTGGTTITGGIIQANSSTAVGSGTVAINGGVRLSLGDNVTLTNAISIGANSSPQGAGILEASNAVTGTATLQGPINITASPAGGGHFINVSSGGTFDVASVITSTVPVIHRSGTITYSGGGTGYTAMTVTGTVRLGANDGLATGATVTLGASGNATLDLAGKNQTLAGIAKTANTNTTTVGNSSTTADSVLTITGTSTFDGVIANAVTGGTRTTGLAITGGTLTLGGVNTYTGNTTIAGGANLNLSDNAQLRFATGVTTNGISGAGSASISGDFNIDTSFTDSTPDTSGSWPLGNGNSTYTTTFQVLSGTTPWTATGDVWTKTVGTKNYSFNEATGVLTMSSTGGGFSGWAASRGLTGGDAAFDADPDHDGLKNGVEFVLGGEPNPANPGSNSAALLPTIGLDATYLTFAFRRTDESAGLNPLAEYSTGLGTWTKAEAGVNGVTIAEDNDFYGGGTDRVVVKVPRALAAPGSKLFVHLKVTE